MIRMPNEDAIVPTVFVVLFISLSIFSGSVGNWYWLPLNAAIITYCGLKAWREW